MTREERLEEENAVLRERIKQLTGSDEIKEILQGELSLSKRMAAILALLFARPHAVQTATIYSQVFESITGDGPRSDIVRVVISQMRTRLAAAGAPGAIVCGYGHTAYRLTDDLRAFLQGVVQPLRADA